MYVYDAVSGLLYHAMLFLSNVTLHILFDDNTDERQLPEAKKHNWLPVFISKQMNAIPNREGEQD